MKDVNYPLRKAYLSALSGITYDGVAVNCYYPALPDNLNPDNYIVFGPVTNNDVSTKSSPDTNSLMRVTIHTKSLKYNSGKAVDDIAGQVLNAIYPNSGAVLDLSADNLQMISTEVASDLSQDYNIKGSISYVDRILIFRHRIYHL